MCDVTVSIQRYVVATRFDIKKHFFVKEKNAFSAGCGKKRSDPSQLPTAQVENDPGHSHFRANSLYQISTVYVLWSSRHSPLSAAVTGSY
jgi:hypothetical protein